MTRIIGPTGSRRRRRVLFAPLILISTALALFFAGSARAVHDLQFQLDGETTSTAYSPPSGVPTPPFDWNNIFNVATSSTTQTVTVNGTNVGSGKTFSDASFQRDFESGSGCTLNSSSTTFCTGDDTTYATGSKDTLGIGNTGWQCNHDNNVNSKIDIMNSYVLRYINPANGHTIFYFGLEKNKNNGTNDVGVWFLRGNASCSAPSGHVNWTGQHQDGDTLVVSEFTQGGGVSTILAFRWAAAASGPLSGDGGCIDSFDNPDPKAGGCNEAPIATGADCKTTGAGDVLCATTNATGSAVWNTNVTTNWLTSDATLGVGNTVVPPDFFEGGIDITAAFAGRGGATPSCFNTSVPDTRSSASVTATLFDYVINNLGECTAGLSTQRNAAASRQINTNGTISSDTDTAKLTITGTPTWGGTLTWYLCGPGVTTCNTSGVVVGSPITVSSTDFGTSAATEKDYTSGTINLTSAANGGEYCWHAKFAPDAATLAAGITAKEDDGTNECFTITPVTPSLTTQASCKDPAGNLASPCVVGDTLFDTATLSGAANRPGTNGPSLTYPSIGATNGALPDSSITWDLETVVSNTCTAVGGFSASRAVTNGNGTYPIVPPQSPVSFSPTAAGTYTFTASYPSDSANTNAAPSVTCPDTSAGATETNTVVQPTSHLSTTENETQPITIGFNGTVSSSTDTATLTFTGVPSVSGTLTFYLCGPIPLGTCNNGGVSVTPTTVSGAASGTTFTSGTATLTAAGRYCWFGQFTSTTFGVPNASDDGSGTSPNPECFTVNPVTPTLTTSASCTSAPCVLGVDTLSDFAMLSGTANNPKNDGPNATYPSINGTTRPADGTITWTLFGPASDGSAQCTITKGPLSPSNTATVTGDNLSPGYGPVSYMPLLTDGVGKYTFAASYPGESPNTNAAPSVTCDAAGQNNATGEQITVIGSASSSSDQRWLPNDRVTLNTTGGTLNGTLTVTLYQGTFSGTANNCTAGAATAVPGQTYPFTLSGAASGSTFNTTNSTFFVGTGPAGPGITFGAPGTYFWLINYHDNNLTSPADRCETSTVSISN